MTQTRSNCSDQPREFWVNEFGFVITPWAGNKKDRLIHSTKPEEGASRYTHVIEYTAYQKLQAENERLTATLSTATCAFCGLVHDTTQPDVKLTLANHMLECEKHPIKHFAELSETLQAKLTAAEKVVGAARELVANWDNYTSHAKCKEALAALDGKGG